MRELACRRSLHPACLLHEHTDSITSKADAMLRPRSLRSLSVTIVRRPQQSPSHAARQPTAHRRVSRTRPSARPVSRASRALRAVPRARCASNRTTRWTPTPHHRARSNARSASLVVQSVSKAPHSQPWSCSQGAGGYLAPRKKSSSASHPRPPSPATHRTSVVGGPRAKAVLSLALKAKGIVRTATPDQG